MFKVAHNSKPVGFVLYVVLALISSTALRAEDDAVKPKPAPTPDWRTLFQMHYTQRVGEFRNQNQLFQNVILVGDSITEGFDVEKFLPGRRVINRGIGADVIGNALPADDKRGVLKRLDESFFDVPATDAFLLIGINDLGDNHTPDVMEAGYREILERVKKGARASASTSSRSFPRGQVLQNTTSASSISTRSCRNWRENSTTTTSTSTH